MTLREKAHTLLYGYYRIYLLPIGIVTIGLLLFNSVAAAAEAGDEPTAGSMAHAKILSEDQYPSASKCAVCHKKIYDEWSSSNHAYSGLSPMFHKFENAINSLAPTINSFCVRCHQSVGTTMGEARNTDLWDRAPVSREGVTCVTCHRVDTQYGKVNGERRINPGTIFDPVYGPTDAKELNEVLANPGKYKVVTQKDEIGQQIHIKAVKFPQIHKSEFCMSCHQVAVNLGIKLEVVWDQYRASPANETGVTCQQCHMGRIPGVPSGYEQAPVAIVDGNEIDPESDHYNHAFYGPGYSIAHPGIFPHNPAAKDWTIKQWLTFNYRAGWGTPEFEENYPEDYKFPPEWEDSFDRETARQIIDENLDKLEKRNELRRQVMEMGTHIDGPFFDSDPETGDSLSFHYVVQNINTGHNAPSGSLGAQPQLWLNVALIDPDGKNIWESGYLDSNGDVADLHSLDVRAGKIELDSQLFNLQTKFLTTNLKGTDREMYLPVNFDVDQLPILRPAQQPVTVMNHPPFVRMEGRSIPPLGERNAEYTVPADLMKKKGTYKLAIRMRSRAEPIYFMKFVGATTEMQRAMNEGILDIHPYTVEFTVK
jgi:hypothetical protein